LLFTVFLLVSVPDEEYSRKRKASNRRRLTSFPVD